MEDRGAQTEHVQDAMDADPEIFSREICFLRFPVTHQLVHFGRCIQRFPLHFVAREHFLPKKKYSREKQGVGENQSGTHRAG